MAKAYLKDSLFLALAILFVLTIASPVQAQTGVQYIYDELGRLVGVIDPSGSAAAYAYDSVGNLLSITLYSATQTSIIQFTPKSGPVGTTVTIYGTGYSTTVSQNTVTFNGTTATISSATANQIVTSVPAGATTGTISVTSPSGTATSTTAFTVAATSGAPTISGFTPTVGTAGTPVPISGTNFDPIAANDKPVFNIIRTVATAATTGSITTGVPTGATSGRISVLTPTGTATSAADFFVPPSPYTATDVVFTGRVAIGQSIPVNIATANKIGLVVFDGTASQRVSLTTTNSTIPSTVVTVFNPSGTILVSRPVSTSTGFIEPQTLPVTGTYTIMVVPTSPYTGTLTLNLWNVVDGTGTLTINGAAVPVSISPPGRDVRLTFSGMAGHLLTVRMTGNTTGGVTVSLRKSDGSLVDPSSIIFGFDINFNLPQQTLPANDTYTVWIQHSSYFTGTLNVQVTEP